MPQNPCVELTRISSYLADWISGQGSVGEESLTDWLLYECARTIPRLKYHKFTRSQEAKVSGADWDWCLITSGATFTLRVQAKRARASRDLYPALAYTNQYGLQIERLIASAKSSNVRPVYAFYPDPVAGTPIACQPEPASASTTGALIAPAGQIYQTFVRPAREPVMRKDVLAKAIPLECLACCEIAISDFSDFVGRYFAGPDAEGEDPLDTSLGVTQEPPTWATSLLQESDGAAVPAWWEGEFRFLAEQTGAVVVWDRRT